MIINIKLNAFSNKLIANVIINNLHCYDKIITSYTKRNYTIAVILFIVSLLSFFFVNLALYFILLIASIIYLVVQTVRLSNTNKTLRFSNIHNFMLSIRNHENNSMCCAIMPLPKDFILLPYVKDVVDKIEKNEIKVSKDVQNVFYGLHFVDLHISTADSQFSITIDVEHDSPNILKRIRKHCYVLNPLILSNGYVHSVVDYQNIPNIVRLMLSVLSEDTLNYLLNHNNQISLGELIHSFVFIIALSCDIVHIKNKYKNIQVVLPCSILSSN